MRYSDSSGAAIRTGGRATSDVVDETSKLSSKLKISVASVYR